MNQSVGDMMSTPGENSISACLKWTFQSGYTNFLSEDPVCSVPGGGPIGPMTYNQEWADLGWPHQPEEPGETPAG